EARIVADEAFAARWGELGPVYGKQWRRWLGPDGREHDQIAALIELLRHNPTSRRMLFDGWNVAEIGEMALPPCHVNSLWDNCYQWAKAGVARAWELLARIAGCAIHGLQPFALPGR